MRRVTLIGLLLALGGCGHNTWWNPSFSTGYSPNHPQGDSINLQRVMGGSPAVTPLTPEPGDIWPGPLPPMPTLQDIERQSGLSGTGELSAPNPLLPPSSATTPTLPSLPPQLSNPATTPPAGTNAPPARDPAGRTFQTPTSQGVTSGGTPGYQTTTTPRGSAVIVPNGDGTSTIIYPDGRIETTKTPR